MAIFKDWDYKTGLIDLTWGGFLFLITTRTMIQNVIFMYDTLNACYAGNG